MRVDWRYQSELARRAISGVHGITGVANLVEVHNLSASRMFARAWRLRSGVSPISTLDP